MKNEYIGGGDQLTRTWIYGWMDGNEKDKVCLEQQPALTLTIQCRLHKEESERRGKCGREWTDKHISTCRRSFFNPRTCFGVIY